MQGMMMRYGAQQDDDDDHALTVNSEDEDNTQDVEAGNDQAQEAEEEDDDDVEIAIDLLTRRLRCLFHVVTWPIVPLGIIVALALIWMLYAAFVQEAQSSCTHPLHFYAGVSIVLIAYTPFHTTMRSYLFSYQRGRDGPSRPPNVRRCDQCFHTIALLYVYAGISMVQTCREDLHLENADSSSCSATCPSLYRALSVYVVTLEVFTFSLILPLLFLPCIYLWLLRQATVDSEALVILQERLREEEIFYRNGGVTTAEILSNLERVKLVSDSSNNSGLVIVPVDSKDLSSAKDANGVKECCICMNDFDIQPSADVETGSRRRNRDEDDNEDDDIDEHAIVRTQCGHIMHLRCTASWVEGRWQQSGQQQRDSDEGASASRARRTTCPLCRNDLRSTQ